jgi:FemAB-related protein (PEP-CTERM system-associated)
MSWKPVIEESYGHAGHYLLAERGRDVVGVLPLFLVPTIPFRKELVSLPFLSGGGLLADTDAVGSKLLRSALQLAADQGAARLELRQQSPRENLFPDGVSVEEQTHKARLLLPLPDSSEELLRSFKSKLRSQVRRPRKEGMEARIGGRELLDGFYGVFTRNMRDLGSPVHSKALFDGIFSRFEEGIRIVMVHHCGVPCATALLTGFRDTLEVPWASSLRRYNRLAPNMLLYWTALEFSCNQAYRWFDFGRSGINDGTYAFKKQWGAVPRTLFWYSVRLRGRGLTLTKARSRRTRCRRVVAGAWARLPLPVANRLGPVLRRRVSL